MNTYETIIITVPTLTEEEERSLVGGFAQLVTDGGGNLVANERMGRRRLAYSIKKCDDGVYTRFLYDSEPAVPKELERRVRLSDRVLRYLTVCLEQEWAVFAKEQAVRDAAARAEADAAREAAALAGAAAETEPAEDEDEGEGEAISDEGEDQDDENGGDRSWAKSTSTS